MFKTVNFYSDGVDLDPREYAALLNDLATKQDLQEDNYSIGGLVEDLEKKFAQMLGKERAVFLPTGTLANHLAVRTLAGTNHRVLIQAESHLYNDSGDCAETLSGLNVIPLAPGQTTFTLAEVKQWVERSAGGRVETKVGVISIESPVRRKDHEMFDFAEMQRICTYARERGIRLHLDGARMFNLMHHSGKSLVDYAALFDTVYVSLWKHFNGTAGAILAGDKSVIDVMFHTRRMFGGSLPHAWPQVALVAQAADTYQGDYARSWQTMDSFIARIKSDSRFKFEKIANGTSRFLLTVTGVAPEVLAQRLKDRGILLPHPPAGATTLKLQLNTSILRTTPEALVQAFTKSIDG